MNLKEQLQDVLRRLPGSVGIYIMDKDGLVVEKVEIPNAGDLEVTFVEFLNGYRAVLDSAQRIAVGPVEVMEIITPNQKYIYRRVSDDYFLILCLDKTGFVGEGRWRLQALADFVARDFGV